MNCNDFTSAELKKILFDHDVTGRSKFTTKVAMCKVIEKLGLLSSNVKKPESSKMASNTAVLKPAAKAKSRKSTKKPAKVKEAKNVAQPKPKKEAKKESQLVSDEAPCTSIS